MLFKDAVNCYGYIASLIDEDGCGVIDAVIQGGKNRRTLRKICL